MISKKKMKQEDISQIITSMDIISTIELIIHLKSVIVLRLQKGNAAKAEVVAEAEAEVVVEVTLKNIYMRKM